MYCLNRPDIPIGKTYNKEGLLVSDRPDNVRWVENVYNGRGFLIARYWSGGSSEFYLRDDEGRVLIKTDNFGETAYKYDQEGNLISVSCSEDCEDEDEDCE